MVSPAPPGDSGGRADVSGCGLSWAGGPKIASLVYLVLWRWRAEFSWASLPSPIATQPLCWSLQEVIAFLAW